MLCECRVFFWPLITIGAFMEKLIGVKEICEKLGLSRTTIWKLRSKGTFPKPVRISERRIAWTESTVNEWQASLEGKEEMDV
jgi:prophage regulatory protein